MAINTNVKTSLVTLLFLLVIATAANAKTIYVDADRPPGGGGTNWADAYKYLQDALADANTSAKPVEIRVAQGTYYPDEGAGVEDANRTETFQLINGVTLKGGYAGFGEADPNVRDIDNYETILSGDLDGNDVPVGDPRDLLNHPNRAENSYHIVTANDVDTTAVLDGFTITAGNANGASWPATAGAGMYSPNSAPTILNCTFCENSAYGSGGGLSRWDDLDRISTITNSIFNRNSAGGYGGGIISGSTTLTNCTLIGNSAGDACGGVYIYNIGNTTALTDCTFSGNSADTWAGGMGIYGGQLTLINCMLAGNSAGSDGGGLRVRFCTETTLANCTFLNNSAGAYGGGMSVVVHDGQFQKLTNCIFSGNSADSGGGGFATSHGYPRFTNCTFSENSSGGDGGAFCLYMHVGTADFNNCILWGNTAAGEGPQIAIETPYTAVVTVSYCDVQGGEFDVYIENELSTTLVWDDVNNINVDPCFVDADGADDTVGTEDDNLRLLADSNCIDAGDNTAVPADTTDLDGDGNTAEPVPYDLDGNPRFIDDLCTTDTGNGTAPVVDMGAYEFLRSDITSDGDVNFKDFAQFALYWRDVACGACGGADLTCDGNVDWNDVRELADNWLW